MQTVPYIFKISVCIFFAFINESRFFMFFVILSSACENMGGRTAGYIWTQTLDELTVTMEIDDDYSPHDLIMKFLPKRISFGLRDGQCPLVQVYK